MRYDLYIYHDLVARERSWDEQVRRKYPWLEGDGWWLLVALQTSKGATRRWCDQAVRHLAERRRRRSVSRFTSGSASKRSAG